MTRAVPVKRIRVLVVDDSPSIRRMIISHLSPDGGIEVVGEAGNGVEAIRKALELRPDLITIDIEMPAMNGLAVIEQIMTTQPVPILVLTARGDADTAFSALAKGALEVMEKPGPHTPSALLTKKVRLLAGVKVITHIRRDRRPHETTIRGTAAPAARGPVSGVVAIASSTGGPRALSVILSGLPADLPAPVLVAQHMAEGFTEGMVGWLNMSSRLAVHLGSPGTLIEPGRVYISPSDRNMAVGAQGEILLLERRSGEIYRPSCDVLLESVAAVYGPVCVGVILTGMGSDGVSGMARIRAAGGFTVAQDEKSSVVFGMPKAAIDRGCIDIVLPLDKIAAELVKRLWHVFPPRKPVLSRDGRGAG